MGLSTAKSLMRKCRKSHRLGEKVSLRFMHMQNIKLEIGNFQLKMLDMLWGEGGYTKPIFIPSACCLELKTGPFDSRLVACISRRLQRGDTKTTPC